MRFFCLAVWGVLSFLFSDQMNAMDSSIMSGGSCYFNMSTNNRGDSSLKRKFKSLERQVSSRMIASHRDLQGVKSEIDSQMIKLRRHFWLMEDKISGRCPELRWIPLQIETAEDEPFFGLISNINNYGLMFHNQASEIFIELQKLNQLIDGLSRKERNAKTEVRQLTSVFEKNMFGLWQDITILEKEVNEQILETLQDIHSLKAKIGLSGMGLKKYLTNLETYVYKNMFELRRTVMSLGIIITEDATILFQNARALQIGICGRFPYKYRINQL